MKKDDVSRRDFGKLTLAAFGGALAGSLLVGRSALAEDKPAAADKHLCCGLNACKGQGAGAKNDCAGQGSCATVKTHGCAKLNDCRGLGGGSTNPGANDCKGQGRCGVPLNGDGWKKARANFEAAMTKAGKKFGPAPASCGK
jgi:hypothetical protein